MAQLLVRNLEEEIVQALRERAARAGHSVEEEHRRILRLAVKQDEPGSFKDALFAIPKVGEDEDFARHADPGRELDW